jgi:hypothetical protein
MKLHFAARHPAVNFDDYSSTYAISGSEKAALRNKRNKRHST